MSKIEQLIKEKCPNGVEYKKLSSVIEVKRGSRLTRSQLLENGIYEVYHGSKDIPLGRYNKFNTVGDTVIIVNTGGIGGVKYLKDDFWCSDGCFNLGHNDKINNKFLYYYLSQYEAYFVSQKRIGGVPTIDKNVVKNIKIPIPPIEVQEEIVKILDKFSKLEAELETELEARKKQYEFYLDKLINKEKNIVRLGSIGKVAMCKRIFKNQTTNQGDIPFYKIGTFGKTADSYISKETWIEYKQKYSYPNKGDILISAAGTIGKAIIFDGSPSYFQDSNIVWIENDETVALNKYLYYFYQTKPWMISSGGTISRIYNDNILKTKLPLPSLQEQERIVKILDKFDKLINDLKEGIPAEIKMRRKQYEYYRNKLLNFKEL